MTPHWRYAPVLESPALVGFNQHGRLTDGSLPPHDMSMVGYLMETNQKPIGDGCTLASSDGPPVNDCYQLVYIDAGGWEKTKREDTKYPKK
ncbi:hypothetical protein C4D60_Mb04t28330 [Musa balbisiana]|uniref:Uncharacterized protein n=1 Tax=Musa balbisiana TaxID=52838 RepID=A0A4S8KFE2_MUSBA|nr:hypothetical protein C4D60_Mb04t28330 [Musa balbisiana]